MDMAMGLDHRQMFQLPAGTGRGGGRGVGRSDPWKEEDSGGGMYGGDGQGKYLPGRCLPSFREHLEHLLWAESP